MKLCVCSDSHGHPDHIRQMLEKEEPQGLFFMGDGLRDFQQITLPEGMYFQAVCGNCDFMPMEPPFRNVILEGKRIFLTHGHLFGAKEGTAGLHARGARDAAEWVFYGHTHYAEVKQYDDMLILCPGSIRDGVYMVVDTETWQYGIRRL